MAEDTPKPVRPRATRAADDTTMREQDDLTVPQNAKLQALQRFAEGDNDHGIDFGNSSGVSEQGTDDGPSTLDDADVADMLAKDYSALDFEDLPATPEGFEFRVVFEGKSYVRRLVRTTDLDTTVIVRDMDHDMLYVDERARRSGIYREMDFRWLNPKNEPDMRASTQYGFVAVTENIDPQYKFEGRKLWNGDLYLAMRPKSVTDQRARQLAAETKHYNERAASDNYVNDDVPEKYGSYESELKVSAGSTPLFDYTADSRRKAQDMEDQYNSAKRDVRSGKRVYSMNAPFQRTIIGGKEVPAHPLSGAVGGNS